VPTATVTATASVTVTVSVTAPVTHTSPTPNASKMQHKFALWCRVGLDSGRMLA
jgi:hypothetical protein